MNLWVSKESTSLGYLIPPTFDISESTKQCPSTQVKTTLTVYCLPCRLCLEIQGGIPGCGEYSIYLQFNVICIVIFHVDHML